MQSAIDLKNEGNKFYKEANYTTAVQYYLQSLAADPHYAPAQCNLAQTYLKLAHYPEALTAFTATVAMDPTHYFYKGNIGQAHALIGLDKPNEAWHVLNKLFIHAEISIEQKDLIAKEKFKLEQRIAAKVSFACIDLKFTKDHQIKILEFGLGMSSGLTGIDHLTPDFTSLQRLTCAALNEELPPIIFNSWPGSGIIPRQDSTAPMFACISAPDEHMDISDLSQYSLIYGGLELRATPLNICKMDDPNIAYALAKKNLIHEACVQAGLEDYRPKTMLISRQYTSTLADEIIRTIPGRKYVIKAPDVENGRGVIIATSADLDEHLKKILGSGLSASRFMTAVDELSELYNEFITSDADQFMIEEYISSKPVSRDDKFYDATMRVVFWYIRDKQKSRCIPFAAYWKLPPQPINNAIASLRERTVSSFRDQRVDALALTEADTDHVYTALKGIIPRIFDTMLTTDYMARIKNILRFSAKIYGQDAQWISYANYLAGQGNFELAMFCLTQVNPDYVIFPDQIEHFTGIAYFSKGDVPAAIDHFERAERQLPHGMDNRHFRMFLAYLEIGKSERAWACIKNHPKHMQKARMIMDLKSCFLDVSVRVTEQKKTGNDFFNKRQYREALDVYESIVRDYPTYAKIWFNIGLSHARLMEHEKALTAYDKAIAYNPNYTKAKDYREKLLLSSVPSPKKTVSYSPHTNLFVPPPPDAKSTDQASSATSLSSIADGP